MMHKSCSVCEIIQNIPSIAIPADQKMTLYILQGSQLDVTVLIIFKKQYFSLKAQYCNR